MTAPGPREAALEILRTVRGGSTFDRALGRAAGGLTDLDRKLAHEIAAGVLRERRQLDMRINRALTHPARRLPDDVRDVLRIGVYQLIQLDRVPPYAVVQTAVDLAKATGGHRTARLVNAVLRRVGREAEAPARADDGMAKRYSHPEWLVMRWTARFGEERTEALLRHNNSRPPLVIQPARWPTDRLSDALAAAGIPHRTLDAESGIVLETRVRIPELPGYSEGAFIVQDPTQFRLLREIGPRTPNALVWDACAAPGGKATILARHHRVLASDRALPRLARLAANGRRTHTCLAIFAADAEHPPIRPDTVDMVLIDAPCSATGTVARHPDARWRLSVRRIDAAARRQRAILLAAARIVRPGGTLAYLTCSLEPEENETQIDAFLATHPTFARESADHFAFPPETGFDGGFAARLRRAA